MKPILIFLLSGFFINTCFSQASFTNQIVTAANNQQYPMRNFKGKIIWVVVLPVTQTSGDTALLARIDSIAMANAGRLKVIAVPSYEDGFVNDSTNTVLSWYQKALNNSIIISQPLFTHKVSGTQQSALFQWLTNSSKNTQFDYDVEAAGSSFFVNAQGALYGIIGADGINSNKVFKKMLQ